jgi:hypothetical protein
MVTGKRIPQQFLQNKTDSNESELIALSHVLDSFDSIFEECGKSEDEQAPGMECEKRRLERHLADHAKVLGCLANHWV